MNGSDLIAELCKMGYVVKLGDDDYTITNNLLRKKNEIEPKTEVKVISVEAGRTLKQFAADCRIPFRAKGVHGGHYQLNAISRYGTAAFDKIVKDNEYVYEDMVAAVGAYYNASDMARVTLTNFFQQNVFENVMKEYLSKKNSIHKVEGTTENRGGRISL